MIVRYERDDYMPRAKEAVRYDDVKLNESDYKLRKITIGKPSKAFTDMLNREKKKSTTAT